MSAKFKSVASTPPRSRAGLQPSDRLQPSLAKKRKTVVVEKVHIFSDDDQNDEDYKEGDGGEPKGKDDEDYLEKENVVPNPVEDIATPQHRPSVDIPESRLSAKMPPSSGTLRASSFMGRREKRKERDPMTSILELLSTMLADS